MGNRGGRTDASVDVVTARSVLIYVADKTAAVAEFAADMPDPE